MRRILFSMSRPFSPLVEEAGGMHLEGKVFVVVKWKGHANDIVLQGIFEERRGGGEEGEGEALSWGGFVGDVEGGVSRWAESGGEGLHGHELSGLMATVQISE